jgi:hypothetical protein
MTKVILSPSTDLVNQFNHVIGLVYIKVVISYSSGGLQTIWKERENHLEF